MKTKNHFAHYMYRCRMCGKTYIEKESRYSLEIVDIELFKSIHCPESENRMSLISYHLCKKGNGNYGISDFIGVRKHKDPFIVEE